MAHALLWTAIGVYLLGFAAVLCVNVFAGPVTLGLALLRAVVWPLWVATGIPEGQRL